MSLIVDGGIYLISDASSPGFSICTDASGDLNLASTLLNDEEKWIFRAIDDQGTFSIESFKYTSTFIEVDALEVLYREQTDEPMTWFVQEAVNGYPSADSPAGGRYQICQDSTCSSYWAPTTTSGASAVSLLHQASEGDVPPVWDIQLSTSEDPTTSESVPLNTITDDGAPPQATETTDASRGLDALKSCPPYGSAKCSFASSEQEKKDTYLVLIGHPVSNCAEDNNQTTTTTVGGTYELETSWSLDVEVGYSFGVVGPSVNMVAAGRVTTGKAGSSVALVAVNPELVVGYSVVYTRCSGSIRALTLPQELKCPSGARAVFEPFVSMKGLVFVVSVLTLGPLYL
ncbi:hypothetical protein BKA70DRAFT_1446619 [Coprinopsis sp. MPI-PUGE-AT-0042]|nr:hypothetical protein BKA70DRAFT_1446619 [Coprinopsis sp. MPI-PUGE-AT-0042]